MTSQPDPSGSKLIPNGSENEIEEMAFGLQEMTVSFHDRAMVRRDSILDLKRSISSMFYKQLLCAQIPKAQKIQLS